MQRRDFLKYSVALGVASALPLWSRAVFAAERPTLPIPDLLTTDARNRIQLTIGAGQSTFGGKTATTWGYNGNLLGPAVKLQRKRGRRWARRRSDGRDDVALARAGSTG